MTRSGCGFQKSNGGTRNPIAASLRALKFRNRVIPNYKKIKLEKIRKKEFKNGISGTNTTDWRGS